MCSLAVWYVVLKGVVNSWHLACFCVVAMRRKMNETHEIIYVDVVAVWADLVWQGMGKFYLVFLAIVVENYMV